MIGTQLGRGEILLREWRDGDEVLLRQAGGRLSRASLRARFRAGVPALPEQYLRLAATAPPWRWSAQVAVRGGELVGWAEFARTPAQATGPGSAPAAPSACAEAELAVTVVDAWQRRGIGTALVEAMLPSCVRAGIRILTAEVELSNVAARAAVARWLRTGHPGEVIFRDGLCRVTLPLVRDRQRSA